MGVPFIPRATVPEMEIQALRNLRRMEVRLLMLDEVHNILAGSAKEQRILLNTLRYLSNELQISLVCLGVSDAREAISGDVQLARRFEELTLPLADRMSALQVTVLACWCCEPRPLQSSPRAPGLVRRPPASCKDRGATAGEIRPMLI